jgi:uncharacterized protein
MKHFSRNRPQHCRIALFFILILLGTCNVWAGKLEDHTNMILPIGNTHLKVEIASSMKSRENGLMKRQHLEKNSGMLFVMDDQAVVCLWMKDTRIPLSAAFIDNAGKVVKIIDLEPLSEEQLCAPEPIRYILEVNRNWFQQNGITTGNNIYTLSKPP